MYFANRQESGHRLAAEFNEYRGEETVVLGLTHGGIPVAYEVASALDAPLDVLVVRKLGAPDQPEFAVGAVAPGATVYDREAVRLLRLPEQYLEAITQRESRELARQEALYRERHPQIDLTGKTVIIVDDGIATGATTAAGIASVRKRSAREIIVAAPVCSANAARRLGAEADRVMYLDAPEDFRAVGSYYEDFTQVSDEDVQAILKRSRLEREAHMRHEVSS